MDIKITIEAPGLEKALNKISESIEKAWLLTEKQEALSKKAEEHYADEPPSKNGTPKTEKPLKAVEPDESDEITLEKIQDLVREKTQAGKMKAIKALLTKEGLKKVSELEEDQYADFHTKLQAL